MIELTFFFVRSEVNLPRALSSAKIETLGDVITEEEFDPATIGLYSSPGIVRYGRIYSDRKVI